MAERVVIRRHPVNGCDRAQRAGEIIGSPIAHHPDRLDRQDRDESLPDFIVKPVAADLVDENRIGLAQDIELFARDLAGAADGKAGAGEGVTPDKAVGQAKLAAKRAHLILEQLAQGLDQL